MPSKMFLSYIHSFRAVAILFIVAGHCIYLFEWQGRETLENVLRSVFQNGTILFVFVAGFLFQHLSRKFEYRKYLRSKLVNVISPYVLVSLPMLALQMATGRGSFDPSRGFEFPTVFHNLVWNLLTGYHILPFWFIPMISVFYLLAPLLLWIDRDGRPYFLLPALLVLTVFVHRPQDFTQIGHSCAYFLPVYLFGMWTSRYKDRVMRLTHRHLWPLTALVLALVAVEVFLLHRGGAIYSHHLFSTENGIVGTNAIQKLLMCWVSMAWLDRYDEKVKSKLTLLAELSFGIYFVHMYFIQAYAQLLPEDQLPAGGLLRYLLLVAVVAALSTLVLLVGKKILGKRSRMFIGS